MLLPQRLSRCRSSFKRFLSRTPPSKSPSPRFHASTPSPCSSSTLLFHCEPLASTNPRAPSAISRDFSTCNVIANAKQSKLIQSIPTKFRSDGDYEDTDLLVCPGCGVYMQNQNPKLPGYFTKPTKKEPKHPFFVDEEETKNVPEISISPKGEEHKEIGSENPKEAEKPVVCARCHSLRHYGKVKDASVENLLPDFDFDHAIGARLSTAAGSRSVVLMVVDAADFDGSFPRKVARLVSTSIEEGSMAWKQGKSGNVPRVVLVVTKIDLLPPSISPTGLEHWVRQRAREGGSNLLTSVHLVSAQKNWGLKNLLDDIRELVGVRGSVWAIGAQNAGKSTLINAIGKHVEGKLTHLTEAPLPGTTLGIIRIEGILPGQAKLFDTPGLLHPYQITTRLTREEQKLVHMSKELKPRTYRLQAGHSIHIGGLTRLDVDEASVETIYLTVWASHLLPLHMGKTEYASMMVDAHFGRQLQPPIGEERVEQLGNWVRKEFRVSGNSWNVSSVDVAIAGLGWFAVGLKGEAVLSVWTYDGVDVTVRSGLVPQRAHTFEVTGFTVSKIVSNADRNLNQASNEQRRLKRKSDNGVAVPKASNEYTSA